MNDFDRLLEALEKYMQARQDNEAGSSEVCLEWDCGIANEMGSNLSEAGDPTPLKEAKAAVEEALNAYIDARIRTALDRRS